MAGSFNRVTIIGNLGRDPESRSFQNGGKVVSLNVACSETWKDKNSGERKERTEWVPVSIFNEGLAGVAEKYLRKGSKVLIEGKFSTRKWQDQSGADRYTTEVVVQMDGKLLLLDSKSEGQREPDGSRGAPAEQGQGDDDFVPFATCDPAFEHRVS